MQLLGTGYQRAAKTSRVLVNNVALTFASWNVELHKDDLPTVNFESYNTTAAETFDEGISGPLGGVIRFGGDWDAHTAPLGTTPGLFPRDDLAQLQFLPSRIDNVPWTFPFARLRTARNGAADIKGKITFDCDGMSQGPITQPTTSV